MLMIKRLFEMLVIGILFLMGVFWLIVDFSGFPLYTVLSLFVSFGMQGWVVPIAIVMLALAYYLGWIVDDIMRPLSLHMYYLPRVNRFVQRVFEIIHHPNHAFIEAHDLLLKDHAVMLLHTVEHERSLIRLGRCGVLDFSLIACGLFFQKELAILGIGALLMAVLCFFCWAYHLCYYDHLMCEKVGDKT